MSTHTMINFSAELPLPATTCRSRFSPFPAIRQNLLVVGTLARSQSVLSLLHGHWPVL